MQEEPDFYQILGLSPDATQAQIKKKFRQLARELHPDVAGDDPVKAQKFESIMRAYEVLSTPDLKEAYDNRNNRPRVTRSFHRRSWRPPGSPRRPEKTQENNRYKKRRWADPKNTVSFDELLGSPPPSRNKKTEEANNSMNQGSYSRGETLGEDIRVTVAVPQPILNNGGTVMVEYTRLIRAGQGVVPYDEIYALRIPPGTPKGAVLRGEKWGNDSPDGGPAGDLICDLILQAPEKSATDQNQSNPGRSGPDISVPEGIDSVVDISISEAVLGGRVTISTPVGSVVVGIPPRTSSGQRLRLQGKGNNGSDWIIATRIVVPAELDSESENLIRQFAILNPDAAR